MAVKSEPAMHFCNLVKGYQSQLYLPASISISYAKNAIQSRSSHILSLFSTVFIGSTDCDRSSAHFYACRIWIAAAELGMLSSTHATSLIVSLAAEVASSSLALRSCNNPMGIRIGARRGHHRSLHR